MSHHRPPIAKVLPRLARYTAVKKVPVSLTNFRPSESFKFRGLGATYAN